ncbi:MAG: alpha/beta fold hydrolase, partial [Terriglobia bacterium]
MLAAGQGASLLTASMPASVSARAARPQQTGAGAAALFPGFKSMRIETKGASIAAVVGGSGPPVLLLHGHPQTHVMWHKVAPRLAQRFSIVAADLRGYGDSSKPPEGLNHAGYSKRAMAQDMAEVMTHLGFEKFAVVGHDRGARVATRMALDHQQMVTKLAVFDNLPTLMMYRNVTKELATQIYHWFFLIQPSPYPETLIGNSLEVFLRRSFDRAPRGSITDEAYAEYLRCFRNPATIHAACEDYRAGASIDLEHDEADWNKKITCPLLALWAERGTVARFFGDVVERWKEKAVDVRGKPLPSGHYLAEQLPD